MYEYWLKLEVEKKDVSALNLKVKEHLGCSIYNIFNMSSSSTASSFEGDFDETAIKLVIGMIGDEETPKLTNLSWTKLSFEGNRNFFENNNTSAAA